MNPIVILQSKARIAGLVRLLLFLLITLILYSLIEPNQNLDGIDSINPKPNNKYNELTTTQL